MCVDGLVCVFVCGTCRVGLAGDTPDLASATSKQPWQSQATKLITMWVFVIELERRLTKNTNSHTNLTVPVCEAQHRVDDGMISYSVLRLIPLFAGLLQSCLC